MWPFKRKKKRLYQVYYYVYGWGNYLAIVEATNPTDLTKIIEKKEAPFHTYIITYRRTKEY